jgi:BirA family biotin operon repressor/biotin-[acetyl-CoA-carboxylase] ligase
MNKRSLRPTILRFESLDSTNTEAARQARRGAPEGLCVVAREQTAGRGRHERVWISPPGAGLYCSTLLRPQMELSAWPLLTLMAALAVHDALLEACGLCTDIKWPNDILACERKLAGILAETVETRDAGRACILGIGINLSESAFPAELLERATSIEGLTGSAPDAERLLQALLRAIARRYEMLEAGARALTLEEWTARSSYAVGRTVRVSLDADAFEGTTRGLEPDGALRVETTVGEIRIIRAGEVTRIRDEGRGDEAITNAEG